MRMASFRMISGRLAVLLVMTASVFGQAAPDTVRTLSGIEITTAVDRADVLVGDLITYTLTISFDSTYELIPPPLGANLGAFDVKDYLADQISTLDDGRLPSVSEFVVSALTTGYYIIPPIPVLFNVPDGSRKVILSEGVPIVVSSLLEEGVDSLDIRAQKAVYEFPRDYTQYYVFGGIGLLLLLVAAYLIWRRLRRQKEAPEPVDDRPPWEIAFEKLALLKERRLPASGQFKQHYLELTDVTREYFGRMYLIDVMEMTTEEFLYRFYDVPLPGSLYERCQMFFPHADLVKFARHVPEIGRPESDLDLVHNFVELVRSDFDRRAAADGSNGPQQPAHHTVDHEVPL